MRPVGLTGELRMIARVAEVMAASMARELDTVQHRYADRHAAAELDARAVADPSWLGNKNFAARIDDAHERGEQRKFSARRDQNIGRIVVGTAAALFMSGQRLAQFRQPSGRRVMRFAGMHGLLGRNNDARVGGDIRIAA